MAAKKKTTKATPKTKTTNATYGTTLSRAELERHLEKGQPVVISYIYSCTFVCDGKHEDLVERLKAGLNRLPGATSAYLYDAEEPFRAVGVEFRKKQWGLGAERAPDAPGRWRLHVTFREKGQPWGSNQAIWRMLRAPALELLKARDVQDEAPVPAKD